MHHDGPGIRNEGCDFKPDPNVGPQEVRAGLPGRQLAPIRRLRSVLPKSRCDVRDRRRPVAFVNKKQGASSSTRNPSDALYPR